MSDNQSLEVKPENPVEKTAKPNNIPKPKNVLSSEILRWILTLLAGAIAFTILIKVAMSFWLPLGEPPRGIVSQVTQTEFDPFSDYLKYLILFVGTFIVSSITYSKSKLIRTEQFSKTLKWFLLISILGIISINLTPAALNAPLSDTFHEGEYLGFLPAFLAEANPFENSFLTHGFGINVLPSLLADRLAATNNGIVLTRLILTLFNAIAYLMAFLTVTITVSLYYSDRRQIFWVACISSLLLVILNGISTIGISYRDTIFLLQLSLLMGFFKAMRSERKWQPIIAASLVGASLPLAFLLIYERSAFTILVVALVTVPILFLGRKIAKSWIVGNIIGVVVGLIIAIAFVGFVGVGQIIDQLLYWSKNSSYIWAIPLSPPYITQTQVLQLLGVNILAQCSALLWLWTEYKRTRSLSVALGRNMGIVTMLAAALVYQRMALVRSDLGHVMVAGVTSRLLIVVLLTLIICYYFETQKIWSRNIRVGFNFLGLVLVSAFAIVQLIKPANPLSAIQIIEGYVKAFNTPDTSIVKPDYQQAVTELKQEVQASSCFFTMTSEGAWYYLFERPSCSRFHQLVYARTKTAQQEVVNSLEQKKPPILLFSNNFWANQIDGISIFNSNYLVTRYVMTKYEPYQTIGEHWFWRRRESPIAFMKDNIVGTLNSMPTKVTTKTDLQVSGTLEMPKVPEKAAIFVTLGEDNAMLWAGSTVTNNNGQWQWRATVPTAILPKSENQLRFWAMDGADSTSLYPLGDRVNVTVLDDLKNLDFLKSESIDPSVFKTSPQQKQNYGFLDLFTKIDPKTYTIAGWAILPNSNKPADSVILTYEGLDDSIIPFASIEVNISRPDVATVLGEVNYNRSGWQLNFSSDTIPRQVTKISIWAFDKDNNQAYKIKSVPLTSR